MDFESMSDEELVSFWERTPECQWVFKTSKSFLFWWGRAPQP